MENEIFIERLKALRKESKLTQEQIAMYLGVDQSLVNKIESGTRSISATIIDKLCALYGCDEDYLLGNSNYCMPLNFAFRASTISVEDLRSIADANHIAMNIHYMNELKRRNSQ